MPDLRKLKNEAIEAVGKGNWRKAATCYANLEKDEPRDPTWPLKLGESLRKLGSDGEAVKAFSRAARGYATGDLLVKAIAVCKIILGIDPAHTQTQDMLAALNASQRQAAPELPLLPKRTPLPPTAVPAFPTPLEMVAEPASSSSEVTGPTGPVARPASAAPSQVPAQAPSTPSPPARGTASSAAPPLARLRLAALVPGARQSQNLPTSGSSAAMELPVDDEFAPRPVTTPHRGAGRQTMATFVLPKTPFFSVLTRPLMHMAIDRVRLIQLGAGQVLFSRGDPGDDLFVVAWGEVAVLVPGPDGTHEAARLGEGELFGEIALLSDQPRTATVQATVESKVLAFDRALLADLVAASPDLLVVLLRFLRERLIANLADMSALFAPFTPLERLALATRFQFVEVDEGLFMIDERSRSPGLFVLLAGEAQATVAGKEVVRLAPGDVFGEISLITGQASTASVTATCKSFILFLPRADFTEVIMTHPQVLEYLSSLVESRARAIGRVDIL
jgi:CRP-like cAMP-binding protein